MNPLIDSMASVKNKKEIRKQLTHVSVLFTANLKERLTFEKIQINDNRFFVILDFCRLQIVLSKWVSRIV